MAEEQKKHRRKYTENSLYDGNKIHKEKYGFIEIDNPEYYKNKTPFAVPEYLIRKPTPQERKEIIVNHIIANNGKTISMGNFAYDLCISKRLMQMIIKQLRDEGIIAVMPTYNEDGRQRLNKYKYVGPPCEKYGSGLTIDMLFDVENKAGFRDWDWEDYKFRKNGDWHELDDLVDSKIGRRVQRSEYLKSVGMKNSYGVKDANFISIRYSHWIEDKKENSVPSEHIKTNEKTGEKYDDRPGWYSAEGIKKFPLDESKNNYDFTLFGIEFAIEYNGEKDNPEVKLFDRKEDIEYSVFSFWGKNCIHFSRDTWDDRKEHLQLIGEFTSK